jgi:hypothetical protein
MFMLFELKSSKLGLDVYQHMIFFLYEINVKETKNMFGNAVQTAFLKNLNIFFAKI